MYNGLVAASNAGLKSVSLPTIIMDMVFGVVEKIVDEVVSEMTRGVRKFLGENSDTMLKSITFVVYNDPKAQLLLQKALA